MKVQVVQEERWLHVRRPVPQLTGLSPAELLARSAGLASNHRLALLGRGEVWLLGEVRTTEECALVQLKNDNELAVAGSGLNEESAERIEAALEACGLPWKRRDEGWVVSGGGQVVREIEVLPGAGGVLLRALLLGWDEAGHDEATALALFLCRTQAGLRWARCELGPGEARLAARVEYERVEWDLGDGLAGIAAGSRLLGRETGALLIPEMARTYVGFQARWGEGVSSPEEAS
jgi:hypothetical protein